MGLHLVATIVDVLVSARAIPSLSLPETTVGKLGTAA